MGIKNFYTEKGDSFPLILLHGNGEDSSYFEHQINEFSKYYKVYAIQEDTAKLREEINPLH